MHPYEHLLSGPHARIDLDAYVANLASLLDLAPPGAELMAVVKADGYGHGMVVLAHAAEQSGVRWLGVARIAEGLLLRREGVRASILVIGPPNLSELRVAVENELALTIGSWTHIDAVRAVASATSRPVRVHLKIDTGMHRYGVMPEEAAAAARALADAPNVVLAGLMTHFAASDELDPAPTIEQQRRFIEACAAVEATGLQPRYRHTANSAAVLAGLANGSDIVRCGIATYGLSPSPEVPVDARFKPVMSLHAVVTRRFTLPRGDGVSYNLTYRAQADEEAAAVSIGYADGLSRLVSNQGWFVVRGQRAPILGRVCMDQTIVRSPKEAQVGDVVTVVGARADGAMTLDDIAEMTGTNVYELATRLMARVPRLYVRGGEIIAWEHLLLGERDLGPYASQP